MADGIVLGPQEYARLLKLVRHYHGWGAEALNEYLATGRLGFSAGNGGSFPQEGEAIPPGGGNGVGFNWWPEGSSETQD